MLNLEHSTLIFTQSVLWRAAATGNGNTCVFECVRVCQDERMREVLKTLHTLRVQQNMTEALGTL